MNALPFIKGMALCQLFYTEAVQPILARRFPALQYSAARLDGGSDVLGFDTQRSMDHHWGPKTQLFVSDKDDERYAVEIGQVLSEALPYEIHGYPTHFAAPEVDGGILTRIDSGPISHGVTVTTIRTFFTGYLSVDPRADLEITDWLTLPEQCLRTITAGRVFHDGLGELESIRETLHYYPRDVWLYLLAAQWNRISQEEPFMARCGDVGDELGSRILAARLIRDVMKLCFLMERQYAPYSKWFGTAFAQLNCAPTFQPIFEGVLNGQSWPEREKHLSAAYEAAARQFNALGIAPPLPVRVSNFHGRPYQVIHGDRFADSIYDVITDQAARRLPRDLGSVDQYVDSTNVLSSAKRARRLKAMYQEE